VATAHRAKLVTPELLKNDGQAVGQLIGELSDEPILAARDVMNFAPEEPTKVEQSRPG
jgi:hypothetical protein